MKLDVLPSPDPTKTWYAVGLSFTCTQCGNCCTGAPGYVWISDVEIDRLAEHLGTSRDEVLERYCRRIGGSWSLKEHRTPSGNYDCIFLHETKVPPSKPGEVAQTRRVCEIYEVRPLQCRTWPFWDGNLSSKDAWRRAGHRCPGIDQGGRQFTFEEIEAIRTAPDWPQRPPTSAAPPAQRKRPAPSTKKR
jgi:Fe-S-cluster containining protein